MRKGLVIAAAALYLLDAFVFVQGIISFTAAALALLVGVPMCLHAAFKDRSKLAPRAAVIGAILASAVAVRATNYVNESLARRRAESLIASLDQFKSRHGGYPDTLEQLVPEFIPQVPASKVALSFNRFEYLSTPGTHTLQWISFPPYLKTYYVLEKTRWGVTER